MKKLKDKSPYKTFAALSSEQKEAVYQQLDDPKIALRSKPLDRRMKSLWKKAKHKGGRPRVGRGSARVLITMERGLMEDADAFAQRNGLTRAGLIAQSVRAYIAGAA